LKNITRWPLISEAWPPEDRDEHPVANWTKLLRSLPLRLLSTLTKRWNPRLEIRIRREVIKSWSSTFSTHSKNDSIQKDYTIQKEISVEMLEMKAVI
jgi:hypothetical protein